MSIATPRSQLLVALPMRPEAAGMARREIESCDMSEDVLRTTQLLVTELVGNCVRHADVDAVSAQIVLFARVSPDHVRVEVADTGTGFDPGGGISRTGLGLRLLDKLATSWGTARSDGAFRVWFEIDRRRGARFSRPTVR